MLWACTVSYEKLPGSKEDRIRTKASELGGLNQQKVEPDMDAFRKNLPVKAIFPEMANVESIKTEPRRRDPVR